MLLAGVSQARDDLPPSPITSKRPKLVLKLAPDLDEEQLVEIAEVIQKANIDGVIVSNTTIQRPKHLISGTCNHMNYGFQLMLLLYPAQKQETGGLSGPPVKPYSLKALKTLRQHLPASIPLIGCGGISTGADALEFAKAGASLVQLYTSFGYEGVGAPRRIKDELVAELKKEGKTWTQVVNEAVNELSAKPSPLDAPVKKGDSAVQQLIEEAEYLKGLLDEALNKADAGSGAHVLSSVEKAEVQASVIA